MPLRLYCGCRGGQRFTAKLPRTQETKGYSIVMIPVQVGTRIAYTVDPARAASMSRGVNVRTVRDRRSNSIVRLIIISHATGNGRAEEPSTGANSRKATYAERLFTDHEPADTMLLSDGSRVKRPHDMPLVGGKGFVHQLKSSIIFSKKSLIFSKKSQGSGHKRAERGTAPTTSSTSARSGSNPCR